jgi:hypothetical protein
MGFKFANYVPIEHAYLKPKCRFLRTDPSSHNARGIRTSNVHSVTENRYSHFICCATTVPVVEEKK